MPPVAEAARKQTATTKCVKVAIIKGLACLDFIILRSSCVEVPGARGYTHTQTQACAVCVAGLIIISYHSHSSVNFVRARQVTQAGDPDCMALIVPAMHYRKTGQFV